MDKSAKKPDLFEVKPFKKRYEVLLGWDGVVMEWVATAPVGAGSKEAPPEASVK